MIVKLLNGILVIYEIRWYLYQDNVLIKCLFTQCYLYLSYIYDFLTSFIFEYNYI
jgi:hypothetical protein